ncbi:hypothetical protein D3C78_1567100 [compost metagenome]
MALGEEFLDRFRRGSHAGLPGVGFEWYAYLHAKAPERELSSRGLVLPSRGWESAAVTYH